MKFIIKNIIFKLKLFLTNKGNNELSSKTFIETIKHNISKPSYIHFGQKVYSQNDEDGIINAILNDIEITNKIFIEIGIGNGIENNTHNLLLKDWSGVWIDNDIKKIKKIISYLPSSERLSIILKTVTPNNLDTVIEDILNKNLYLKNKIKENREIDFLSIDIDSFDCDCIDNLSVINPRLICIEYNGKFLKDHEISISKHFNRWDHDDYFGSSLLKITKMMKTKKYELVSTNITGNNAFFVKESLFHKCITFGQDIDDLYIQPNYNLYDYYVSHYPTLKFLRDNLMKKNER